MKQSHLSWLLVVCLTVCLLPACGVRRTPDLQRIFTAARERTGKPPLIIIPGILGSELINKDTNEKVWASAFRSDDDDLRLPITPDLKANRDRLVPGDILRTARFARLVPEVYIYKELLGALKDYAGYREGDWQNPAPDGDRDTYYVFSYDWRRDNAESAQELTRRIRELKLKLNRPDLRFNIVAHSMGGLVARYSAMYADAELADDATNIKPTWAGAEFIDKIFMFGTPNAGSMDALATLLEGYSITEGLRRRISLLNSLTREDALTIPSIFQLLPPEETAKFLDEDFRRVKVDLYDIETWRRYGWTAVFDEKYREQLRRARLKDRSTAKTELSVEVEHEIESYLSAVLRRARSFHRALNQQSEGDGRVKLFALGGDCEETLAAAILVQDKKNGRWRTITGARDFRTSNNIKRTRREVIEAIYEPGDGRVTRASLLGENIAGARRSDLYDTALPITYAAFACDLHGDVQKNKSLQDNALTIIISEATK